MKESLVYLSLLQYIKYNGTENFNRLFEDIDSFQFKKNDILEELIIFNKIEELNYIIRNNFKLICFLKSLRHKNINFLSKEFRCFIKMVELNLDKINVYIENARKLVELGIDAIDFASLQSCAQIRNSEIYYDCSSNVINKYIGPNNKVIYFRTGKVISNRIIFTDGTLNLKSINIFSGKGTIEIPYHNHRICNDENYRLNIKDASFILESENHENNMHFKYITIPNFDFRVDRLPSKNELEGYNEPEYVKQYKKTFK